MDILLWHEILEPYELAVKELQVKFRHLIKEHHGKGLYSPIESVSGRVKSVSSILEKMQRKGIVPEEMEEQVEDIAGIRMIQKRSDIEIKSEKDYIRHMKDSGYRSYHLIVYYTVETMNGPKRIQVEIQIRTMAMDFWATIEHSLQYKYKANIPDHIRERLSAAAKAIIVLDNEMSSVRSEIMDAQNSSQIQRNLITDILNNIENLYKVTNKREVEKIQDEFYHIYAQNDLQELKRFHKELDLIAEGYRAQAITDEL